jgi:AcrR family transcriptional regulator
VSRRTYRQEKRKLTTEETRQRIVEATMALHAEKGITTTTYKDIAERADVGIGTVYHHFPTYDDVVRACGARAFIITRPPTPEIFAGLEPLDRRIERLVQELFAYYERYPAFERGRCDRDKLPVLAEGVARRERMIESVVREALSTIGSPDVFVRTTVALTDYAVYRSLTTGGLSTQEAAAQVTEVLLAWLKTVLPVPNS